MYNYVRKVWGSEQWLLNNNLYCAKFLNLVKGYQCSLHYHKLKDETFYILDGMVELEIYDSDTQELKTQLLWNNDSFRIKPGVIHRFRARSATARILEVSTTHFESDSYRLEKSCECGNKKKSKKIKLKKEKKKKKS